MKQKCGIEVKDLSFSYASESESKTLLPPLFDALSFSLPVGARALLVGANGAGKSTLLRVLAGFHFVKKESVQVFGKSPFFEGLSRDQVTLVEGNFPLNLDLKLTELIGPESHLTKRQKELFVLLGLQWHWRMHRVSDGEKRRVQLFLALRNPVKLLLLDEVTIHLDLDVRGRLLQWLKQENQKQKMTIIYTTHILDGLWRSHTLPWPTHFMFLENGHFRVCEALKKIPLIQALIKKKDPSPLLSLSERWMRKK